LPAGATDAVGGPSPPPGRARDVYIAPVPIKTALPKTIQSPRLNVSSLEYRYSTVAGDYIFPVSVPYVMRYESPEGDQLASASTFLLAPPDSSVPTTAQVVDAAEYVFRVRYAFVSASSALDTLTVTYDFRDDGPPKITAELNRSDPKPVSVMWLTLTADPVVSNGTAMIDLTASASLRELGAAEYRLAVGPDLDPTRWHRLLELNWSDAKSGKELVGRFVVAGLEGVGVAVTFPPGMTTIDPTVVGSSAPSTATDYAIQRKSFVYAGRYWAFWYDGVNIAYASSRDGSTWNPKMSTPSGLISYGFDVDQRDGTVLVGYAPSSKLSLNVLKGTISGAIISWSGPTTVASWSIAEAGPPTVAMGTDGYLWAAVPRRETATQTKFYVYRSTAAGATSFALSHSNNLAGAPPDSVARVLTLSNGWAYLVVATKGYSNLHTYRYTAAGWGPLKDWTTIGLPTSDYPRTILSAIALPDDRVRVVFRHNTGEIRSWRFEPDDQTTYGVTLDTRSSFHPAVSVDANGESHAFYRHIDVGGLHRIYYVRQRPALDAATESWSTAEEPFGTASVARESLTATPTGTDRIAVLWTEGTSSYNVMFGAVATPLDFGSQTGEPWNRQGISPFQSYFRQLSEYVSPGSGLLTVGQTDFTIPGRGLDLTISRVFRTPRAFSAVNNSPFSSLFEDYPYANLGKGWQLDLPWISAQYLHLWNGQMYVVRWQGNEFINHDGEHFILTRSCVSFCYSSYKLHLKSGIEYTFDSARKLNLIRDLHGNEISFAYSSGRISSILDTTGHLVIFNYNANGTLQSIVSGPLKATYAYQSVGGITLLRSVKDGLSRETVYEHTASQSPYLMTAIRYPTGAKGAYTWTNPAVTIGPDLKGYYVTLQDTLNSTGASLRSNAFDYTIVNGGVTYVKVTTYQAGVAKGSTVQHFDSAGRRSVTIHRDAAGTQLGRQVLWYDLIGAVSQLDVYPGASATPSHSFLTAYDDWGNVIYSRDGLGHERFGSYANTRHHGGFIAPGRIARSTSGLLFFDDFEDRDLSDWTLTQTAGSVTLDYGTFDSVPPTMKVAHNGGASGVASATHTFTSQAGSFVAEAYVRPQETNRQHYILLDSTSGTRVYVSLRENGYLSWWSGSVWNDVPGATYQANQWYHVAFEVDVPNNKYDIWFNDKEVKTGATMTGSGSIDRMRIQASCSGCGSATTYVDAVKVYTSLTLTVNGLTSGQVVKFEDGQGRIASTVRVASGSTSASISLSPGILPHGTIRIYNAEWTLELSSPTHEFWGGDTWTYTSPWRSMALTRTTSGFLRTSSIYVDDSTPTGAVLVPAEDGWDWGAYDFPVSGASSHQSKYLTQTHQHYFQDATTTLSIGSNEYHVQYIFVPDNQYPSEIMLQFRDTANSWEHRAYWGSNLIPWGTDGTASRRNMGGLPGPSGRWLMLLVTSNDVGTNGLVIEGLAYTLYGGKATWDLSAKGDSQTGQIRVTGLFLNWKVDLHEAKPPYTLKASSGLIPGTGIAQLNVYLASIRAFPFDGYFVVRDTTGAAVYRSPVLTLWGGDEFRWDGTNFFGNVGIGPLAQNLEPAVHDRLVGILEYQTGRSGSPQVPQDAYVRYTANALPDRVKIREIVGATTTWRETTLGYDTTYGLLTSVTDPLANIATYAYSPTYGRAYLTKTTDDMGNSSRYTYDPGTGWLLSARDPSGRRSRYEYDVIGRPTVQYGFDLSETAEALYLDMESTTEEATPKLEDLTGKNNHGTISGATSIAGRRGFARDFSGTIYDYVSIPDSASMDISTAITVAAWVKPEGAHGGGYGGVWFDQATSWRNRVLVKDDGSVWAQFRIGGVDKSFATAAGWAPLNVWTHVAYTYDGATERVYINGRQQASQASSGTLAISGAARLIGRGYNAAGAETYFFNGGIDEVRVFSRSLSATEVASLHDDTHQLLSSSEVAYDDAANVVTFYEPTTKPRLAHLDMATFLNGKLEDFGGRGSHGSLTGTTAASGKVGGARDFDGSDDMVTVAASPALAASSAFTAAAWINPDTLPTSAGDGVVGKLDFANAWRIWIRTDGKIEFDAKSDTVGNLVSTTALTTSGGWYHVAGSFDGSTAKLYVNGVAQASASTSDWGNTANVNIGVGDTDSTSPFDGQIDEVHLFSRALSDAEVTSLFEGTEKGHYQKQYFDSLARTTRSLRRDLFESLISAETYAYNFRDQVTTYTSAMGNVTTLEYDFLGRRTKVTHPDLAFASAAFDDVNRVVTIVAENGRKMQYVYDIAGRMASTREYYDPLNYYSTTYTYDDVDNLLTVTNALGQVTRHDYDNMDRLTKTTYADSNYGAYTYDGVGNLVTRRDRSGSITTYVYDGVYRLDAIDYPGTNQDIDMDYDANGNPVTISNPSATVTYAYDGLDRVKTETTSLAGTSYALDYAYDAASRLTLLTYPTDTLGLRLGVSYLYDSLGRTSQVNSGSTTYATFTYQVDDLIRNVTFGNGMVQSFAYNARGWPASIKATFQSTTYFDLAHSYDGFGNVLSMGSSSYTYDRFDRLKTAVGGFGSHFYDYDALANRKRLDTNFFRPSGAGSTTQWTRSGSSGANWDRVDEAVHDGDSTYVYTSTAGNRDLYALQDNTQTGTINAVTVSAVGRAVWSSSCDPNCNGGLKLRIGGSATGESAVKYVGTSYETISNTWTTKPGGGAWTDADVDGLQAGIELASGGTASTVRVTQVYVTVNVGDSAVYSYADGTTGMNTLSSFTKNGATTSFTYDLNGNLNSKTGGWTYEWSYENLMTKSLISGAQQQAYVYDGLGRRVKVEGTSQSIWTVSIFSGLDSVYERSYDGVSTTDAKYVFGNGIRIAKVPSTGPTQYYLTDLLGSTKQTRDQNRDLVFSTEYEPFGKPYAVTGGEAYKFAGEKHDDPTGLVYLRARLYDPEVGRFVGLDPVLGSLSSPQTLNRYAYVTNNPLRYADPSGLFHESLWGSWGLFAIGLSSPATAFFLEPVLVSFDTVSWYQRAGPMERSAFVLSLLANAGIGVLMLGALVEIAQNPWKGINDYIMLEGWGREAYPTIVRWLGGTPTPEGGWHGAYWAPWAQLAGQTAFLWAVGAVLKGPSRGIFGERPSFKSPNEAIVYDRWLRPTSRVVMYEPLGDQAPISGLAPDFYVVEGPYWGWTEVAGRLGPSEVNQARGLAWLGRITGRPTYFFFTSASDDILRIIRQIGVRPIRFR